MELSLMQKTRALYDIWFQRSETASRTAEQSVLLSSFSIKNALKNVILEDMNKTT